MLIEVARAANDEKELIGESVSACQRLIRMVNSMLDITQIESGKLRIDFASTDLPKPIMDRFRACACYKRSFVPSALQI